MSELSKELEEELKQAWEKAWETCENVINQKFGTAIMEPEKGIIKWFGEYLKMREYQKERELEEEKKDDRG